jgi:hypothetical protein
MPDTITIICPECEKPISATTDVIGKKIRCKGCGTTFPVTRAPEKTKPGKGAKGNPAGKGAPPAKKEPASSKKPTKPADDEDGDGKPYGLTITDLAPRCPDCANEMESEDSVVCLHCGYNTQTRTRFRTKKIADVTGGDVFMWLLPGILCVVGILILLTIDIVWCVNIDDWVGSGDEWYSFIKGGGIKLWLCIGSAFISFFLGKYAFYRLVINNQPPEIELKD